MDVKKERKKKTNKQKTKNKRKNLDKILHDHMRCRLMDLPASTRVLSQSTVGYKCLGISFERAHLHGENMQINY